MGGRSGASNRNNVQRGGVLTSYLTIHGVGQPAPESQRPPMNGDAKTDPKKLVRPHETRLRQSRPSLAGAVAMLFVAVVLSACDAAATYSYPVLGSEPVPAQASASVPLCSTP